MNGRPGVAVCANSRPCCSGIDPHLLEGISEMITRCLNFHSPPRNVEISPNLLFERFVMPAIRGE
jgi:hypothetical protein